MLGRDEMIKRISCRVVNSVPLGQGGGVRFARVSRDVHAGGREVGREVGCVGDVVTYTARRGILRESMECGMSGRVLDCYI